MIKNDTQRAVAKRKHDEARSIAREGNEQERAIYSAFAEELEGEIREYDSIKDGYVCSFKLDGIDDLVDVMVKCRIAADRTQAELASSVGVAPQQIQRYENGGYEKAALWKVAEVLDVLGFSLEGVVKPIQEGSLRGNQWSGLGMTEDLAGSNSLNLRYPIGKSG